MAHAQGHAQDAPETSASEKHLQEITVMADRGWVEDGKIVFLPSKSEKNLSNSPASLIESMHLPMLKVKDEKISTLSGESVAIFINGIKADNIDLSTFWPKLAKRVEYIENPADAKFRGNAYVVNFIMTEYAVGGVTQANTCLATPRYGNFGVASKLVYKKMTFGATISGNSDKENWDSHQTEHFDNLYYQGTHYDRISREFNESSTSRRRYLDAAINARYTNGDFTMTHTAALAFGKTPYERGESHNRWSPELFTGEQSYHEQSSKTFTPQISGDYHAKLNEKWSIMGEWSYAHGHNNGSSLNKMGDTAPITNSNIEDVNSLRFNVTPVFRPNDKWFLHLNVSGSLAWYDTRYSGSTDSRSDMRRDEWSAQFRAYWKPRANLSLALLPGIAITRWKVGNVQEKIIKPLLEAQISWSATRKLFVGGRLKIYDFPPPTSETNPVLTRQSQLVWVKGNPHLKEEREISSYLTTSYIANNWLQLALMAMHDRVTDNAIFDYRAMPDMLDGLLKTPYNAGTSDIFILNLQCGLGFFNNTLNVDLGPTYNFYNCDGRYARSLHTFYLNGGVSYSLRNCRFSLNYSTPYESYGEAGTEKSWRRDAMNFSFTYGNGNLFLKASVEDILNTRTKSRTTLHSGEYSSFVNKYETGRVFKIYLSYTFGYGKKVDQSIDISGPQSVDSSVLR
ncbi:MAG: outer membrane beta-barrel protein [[Clostridium] fimetarium]|nr:outer membrane beta-barrel protein [[Clostridium] fimetarium]